jgi:hypothetical protein
VAALIALVAVPGYAAEYFVDFGGTQGSTCSDANPGTSRAAPWCTLPGTRNKADTAWQSTAWGAINGTARIGAGDTIWIKGGTTTTSARGGRIHIGYWSGKSFYNAGTSASPKQIRNGADASPAWGSGPVTIDCAGMTIDTNPGYGCLNLVQDTTQVNFTNILGSGDAARIRVINSPQYGISATIFGGSPRIDTLKIQYFEVANSGVYGINVDSASNASLLNGIAHHNGLSGAIFGGYGNAPCLNCSMVDIEAYNNGATGGSGGNSHGADAVNSGTAAQPVVFLRVRAHNNVRDGFDNGLVTTSGVTYLLGLDCESYDNGEDGFACSGDPGCTGCSVTCSWVNSIAFRNGNSGAVAYEPGVDNRLTQSVVHATSNASVGCVGTGGPSDGTVNLRLWNSICFRPGQTSAVAWQGNTGAGGAGRRHSTASLYVPNTSDAEYVAPANRYNYAGAPTTNPGNLFTTWSGNKIGLSNDTPPLFRAVSPTQYSGNDYAPASATSKSVDSGIPYCTVTAASGSGTTLTTSCDPRLYFFSNAGRPGVAADIAYVGAGRNTPCTVTALTANQIICAQSITWNQNDVVSRKAVYGTAPDIGVLELRSTLPAPTLIAVDVLP